MEPVELTDEHFPTVYEPSWDALRAARSEGVYMESSFYLLREATHWMSILSSLQSPASMHRNDAIIRGLLVRATKLMRLMLRELKEKESFQQLSISRAFIETFANLVYLVEDDGDGARYDQYVMHSLVAEREVLKDILKNINQREGEAWEIEERIRRSIGATAKAANINDVSALPARKNIGFPAIEERLKLLGIAAYTSYRLGSSETHGDWNDLYRNHLEYNEPIFSPNLTSLHMRPQPPLMATILATEIVTAYFDKIVSIEGAREIFTPKLSELMQRARKVDGLHEAFLQQI